MTVTASNTVEDMRLIISARLSTPEGIDELRKWVIDVILNFNEDNIPGPFGDGLSLRGFARINERTGLIQDFVASPNSNLIPTEHRHILNDLQWNYLTVAPHGIPNDRALDVFTESIRNCLLRSWELDISPGL